MNDATAPPVEARTGLTVTDSFDEAARALTLTAARRAGLQRLSLLEEPQPPLRWLDRIEIHWQ